MDDITELILKRLSDLEKKLEKYFYILKIDNELDYILKGSYLLQTDIDNILVGTYQIGEGNE